MHTHSERRSLESISTLVHRSIPFSNCNGRLVVYRLRFVQFVIIVGMVLALLRLELLGRWRGGVIGSGEGRCGGSGGRCHCCRIGSESVLHEMCDSSA